MATSFALRLKELRAEKNLNQEQLAKEIGVERSSVGKYETGTMPSADILVRTAQFFGVSLDYLLGRCDERRAFDPARHVDEQDVKVALFGGSGEVTDEMWDEVKKFADYVKHKYEDKRENNDDRPV